MVKRSRDQSTLSPRRAICARIAPPCSAFHCQVRSTNASRPSSRRLVPSAARAFSTSAWTAIEAWSVPGSQRVSKPCMRLRRTTMSISVCSNACPMCRLPVTLGGGMTTVNGGRSLVASAVKYPASTQRR